MNCKYNYNWARLTRQELINFFWQLYPTVQNANSSDIHSAIYQHVKSRFPIKISKKVSRNIKLGMIFVGGAYYNRADLAKNRPCIELKFYYAARNNKYSVSRHNFYKLCKDFADTLLHEIIHMRQYRRRNFVESAVYRSSASTKWQRVAQTYLGNSDEIDAFSFNIACELLDRYRGDRQCAIEYLNSTVKPRHRHDSWHNYLDAFDYDHSNKIICKVKKRVIEYLPRAERGKPFNNRIWLDK